MKRLVFVLAALGLAAGAGAQDGPWTLSQCIDYALEHNLTVQRSELTVTQREIDLSTAEGGACRPLAAVRPRISLSVAA